MSAQDNRFQRGQEAQKELHLAIRAFFYSDGATPTRVRDVVTQELTKTECLKRPELAQRICIESLESAFAKEYSESFENEDLLNHFVKLHGDQAYEELKRDRPSLPNHSFVKGIMHKVQNASFAIQIRQSISEVLVDLETSLMSVSLRKRILEEDGINPFSSKEFGKLLSRIIRSIEIR